MSGSEGLNSTRVMRAYRALRFTGRVAMLMRSQGLKAAEAVNPAALAVDAALAVLDVGRAYFRLSTERERTHRLENELKTALARLAAEAACGRDGIALSRRRLEQQARTDRAVMAMLRLLEMASKILGDEMAALAKQEDNLKLVGLTRRYELFMSRYMRVVEQSMLTRKTGKEEEHGRNQ